MRRAEPLATGRGAAASAPGLRGGMPGGLRPDALVGRDTLSAVLARPDLWPAAVGLVRRFAAPGWWRRRPWLPLPDADLWRFRMVTAYGDPSARPTTADVLGYLEWCRDTDPARRAGRGRAHGAATHAPALQGSVGDGAVRDE